MIDIYQYCMVEDEDVINVYDPLVNELIAAATETYYMMENGSFTVHVEDNIYYIDGQEVNPIIECPYPGLVYDDFYCSKLNVIK